MVNRMRFEFKVLSSGEQIIRKYSICQSCAYDDDHNGGGGSQQWL